MSTQSTSPVYPEPQNFPEVQHDFNESPVPAESTNPMPPATATAQMPHVEHSYSPERFACIRCGSKNLAPGYIIDYGDKFEQIHFAPKRVSLRWLNSLLALRPWRSLAKLGAVACRDCGAVLITVDPEELRHAERRRE
jgi:hypothetical protein